MKNIIKRSKGVLILLAVLLPLVFITYYGQLPGKIIGFSFYFAISCYAAYEIVKNFKLNEASKILIVVATMVLWIFPLSLFKSQVLFNWETGANFAQIATVLQFTVYYTVEFNVMPYFGLLIAFIIFCIAIAISYKTFNWSNVIIGLLTLLIIPSFFKLMMLVNAYNWYYIFAIELIAASVDTFGLFGGMAFGNKIFKRKMAPNVSPKKTWEGAICSILGGVLVTFLVCYLGFLTNNFFTIIYYKDVQIILACIFLPPIAIFGDLLFSKIKRIYNIKDYSNLIPGHGGIMDRFDSVSLVALIWGLIFTFA